ncbi:MAG TPA: transcriptional repressor [Thermodesulfobacteriaceae bacterium]|nr:transcriptional repressor [Thermodesulfobacteriaceae bacterium]
MSDSRKRFKEMVEALREQDYRLTPQRLEIIRVLAQSRDHPSAEEVFEEVRNNFPTTSLATVYRNILKLKELGQILELGFPEGGNRYDGNRPFPHPHVICIRCRRIMDPDLENLEDLTSRLAETTGFKIVNHRLDFFGICPGCQDKAE